MNTARTLGKETSYLRLARGSHDAQVTEAVRDLDERLAEPHAPQAVENVERFLATQMQVAPQEPRSPHTSPVTVGEVDFFRDPYDPKRVSWRLVEAGGEELIVIMASRAYSFATAASVDALVAGFKAELGRYP